jgi:hypothetical protein
VFPVGDVVQRLLADAPSLTATASFGLEDLASAWKQEAPAPPSSLTLGDLEGADAEILEKTLVDTPLVLPEAKAEAEASLVPPPAPPPVVLLPEAGENTLTGYTSARDAIDKLFAGTPAAAQKATKDSSAMDMEATLSALEATLGGATPPAPSVPDGDTPTASGRPPQEDHAPSTTTVRLTQEDLRAALRAGTPAVPPEALHPSDLRTTPEEPREPAAPSVPHPQIPERVPVAAAEDPGAEQLRLKIDEEIYPGLTMAQLTAWVEEGRILEHHLVARQHSENWLEAHKVPGLRPVFERQRRERSGGAPALDTTALEIAPKKSLFGGLFGKN